MAMELMEVPPLMTPMEKVVQGSGTAGMSANLDIALPSACMGLGMPKSPLECPPGPLAAGARLADALAASVYGKETVDLVRIVLEEVLHSVEIAEAFFSYVTAEYDAALGLNSALPESPEQAEHVAQMGRVVANTRAVIPVALLTDDERRIEREYRIEVGAYVERRSARIAALDDGVDVVHLVSYSLVALGLDHLLEAICLLLLMAGEGRDLHEL